ncbi:MAG: DUF3726 domain-containing protein [Gammaproteobacteria bacterium]|nr:DUF3726 domain-containing protein [Gammaproteobacteria bacterium]MDG1232100.1 DUF3726 domain-containing protein [Pseudomonadales bacterium]
MKFSRNELKFAVRWAALGRNVPVGLADDLAKAAMGLAAAGIDPLKNIVSALEQLDKHHCWGNMSDSVGLSVIEAGPVLADSLVTGEMVLPPNAVLDNPVLLAGYLCHAPISPPMKLGWQSRGSGCVLVVGKSGLTSILGDRLETLHVETAVDLLYRSAVEPPELISAQSIAQNRITTREQGLELSEADWHSLWRLTQQALSKSSKESRLSGAGASLVDTD